MIKIFKDGKEMTKQEVEDLTIKTHRTYLVGKLRKAGFNNEDIARIGNMSILIVEEIVNQLDYIKIINEESE